MPEHSGFMHLAFSRIHAICLFDAYQNVSAGKNTGTENEKMPIGQEDKKMENMKKLEMKELENVCGGLHKRVIILPGIGIPPYWKEKKDEPKDGGATGSW